METVTVTRSRNLRINALLSSKTMVVFREWPVNLW